MMFRRTVATDGVYHPNRNGTYIQTFNRANPSIPSWQAYCTYSPDCIYSSQTVLFYVRNPNWTCGAHYYIMFSSGAASGNIFCAPESAPIIDPGLSSTQTTTTTTPPTTVTVTTRPISTTISDSNLTTTGIIITTASPVQSTTTLTTTTTTTTETTINVTTTTATTTLLEIDVLTPKELEERCKQPLVMGTITSMLVMAIVNVIGIFALFTKLEKLFNPSRIAVNFRQRKFTNRVGPHRA